VAILHGLKSADLEIPELDAIIEHCERALRPRKSTNREEDGALSN
jgi:hypothetical protein